MKERGVTPVSLDGCYTICTTQQNVNSDEINWLSFHSGYDFGYLLKVLNNTNLPAEEAEFFDLLQIITLLVHRKFQNTAQGR